MQSKRYNFIPVHQIQQILIQMKERRDSHDELKNLSYKVEPPVGGGALDRINSNPLNVR